MVLYATRVGIPILLPSSLLRRCNHGTRRSAHVDQCRNTGRKPDGAALHRGDWPARSPKTRSTSDVFTPTGRTKMGHFRDGRFLRSRHSLAALGQSNHRLGSATTEVSRTHSGRQFGANRAANRSDRLGGNFARTSIRGTPQSTHVDPLRPTFQFNRIAKVTVGRRIVELPRKSP